ncbi:hypothetical protein B0H13DRAFT_2032395 [Mycena leptocephala]|nr:hypothetical protein B0H13DRAFT_2032395 [Mycena leptocephala]
MTFPVGGGGGAGVIQVVHMDDAAPELSDLVRRRFSIAAPWTRCTMDTSTWRRSNLSPGNVVSIFLSILASRFLIPVRSFAKKCGFFERTDSCPRPEQRRFPFWEFVATLVLLMSHHPPPLPFRPSRSPTFFSPYFVSSTSVPFSQPLRRLHTLAHLHRASLCPARRHPGGAPAAPEVGKGKGTAR